MRSIADDCNAKAWQNAVNCLALESLRRAITRVRPPLERGLDAAGSLEGPGKRLSGRLHWLGGQCWRQEVYSTLLMGKAG